MQVSPNVLSAIKLFVFAPLFLWLMLAPPAPWVRLLPIPLFLLFGLLDYLDGLIARHQERETPFGRVYDRLADYPVLFALVWLSVDVLPAGLLSLKVGLDVVLLGLFALGHGPAENRLRTAVNFLTLLMLMLLMLDVNSRFITGDSARALLILNVFVTALVILRNLGVLRKRFIADALSAGNLLCGFGSMWMAWYGRLDLSLLFLLLGAVFDGLDGAAARRFGSTRFGVLSDDIADAVNYGIAPGVAIVLQFRSSAGISVEGVAIGVAFIAFTIGRLVFFTLNKKSGDPEYFRGVPSTVGGIVVLSSAYLFRYQPALLGFMVGMACALMVAFDSRYRHLGRLLAAHRLVLVLAVLGGLLLFLFGTFGEQPLAIAAILVVALVYGFLPTVLNFREVWRARR
ncbi:MAG: hypothetical protein A2140_03425 [Candidatus Muproteobacteria bacterium RBG_16_62_13]|uniref:CDP-alcohol phosphatidyltransferase n=1 Tax=Candidatus Muproteobacteria bacterium RBG_16_62_13 TaxID=1817756 RepID=A0A1F6T7D6_9PROT|nr:MAG: hypothetical protein A2140_03425 [Candidatus Muproteobacteria bacterium RBG_16_62_13]